MQVFIIEGFTRPILPIDLLEDGFDFGENLKGPRIIWFRQIPDIFAELCLGGDELLEYQKVLIHNLHERVLAAEPHPGVVHFSEARQHIEKLLEGQSRLILVLPVEDVVVLALLLRGDDLGVQQHPLEVLDLQQAVVVAVPEAAVEDEDRH